MPRAWYLADQLASEILQTAGVPARAHVSLDQVGGSLGVQISSIAMEQDGRLVIDGDLATVFVNSEQSRARQRFSAAHELVHWVLRSPRLCSPLAQEAQEAFYSLETMCNTVAGAVLMPYGWVKEEFADAAAVDDLQALAVLDELARRADVSLAAAAVRMRDVFAWRRTLLHWTLDRGSWTFAGEAGLFASEQGLVVPTAAVGLHLSRIRAAGAREVHCVFLPLIIGSYEDDYYAEVMVYGEHAVALIELTPTAPETLAAA